MADRPYQAQVDQFLADYQDKFLPSLVTGKGTAESPYTNMTGPETAVPLTKEQLQLERDNLLAKSVHPDTFNKVLETFRGERAIPSHDVALGSPASQFSNSPGGQAIMRDQAIPIPHVSTGFNPPANPADFQNFLAANPPDFASSHGVIDMTPGPTGAYEAAPIPKSDFFQYTKPDGSLGFTDREAAIPPGVTGIQARNFADAGRGVFGAGGVATGPAIPASYGGETAIPTGANYEMPSDIKSALANIQKILMQPSGPIYAPSGRQAYAGGYRPHQVAALEGLGGVLEKLGATGATYQAKMAELNSEAPYRNALGDYYRRMAGVHEAAIPSEEFQRYAMGAHALSESQRPYSMAPGSAVYQGAKLLGYVPEKQEAIHPVIRDVINKSTMVDPTTGMATGFDIRGARQKIGFMAPWLKAQGIEVPKEAYKMTKPEFMAEQKTWAARLPKKDRSKYTPEYTDQLWNEYWGKD